MKRFQIILLLIYISNQFYQEPKLNYLEIYTESQSSQRIYAYANESVTPYFSPNEQIKSCQPTSKLQKVGTANETNKYQNSQTFFISSQISSTYYLKVQSNLRPDLISLDKTSLIFSESDLSDQSFTVSFDCSTLLKSSDQYFDTIQIDVFVDIYQIEFEYIMVCDPLRVRSFDINTIILFTLALLTIIIAIKTPPFLFFQQLSQEEQEATDIKITQAIMFFFCASFLLFTLYVFIDYLKEIFTILVMLSSTGCISILTEEIFLQGFNTSPNNILKKEIDMPVFGKNNIISIIGYIMGLILTISWYLTKNWILNNLIALTLAVTFLKTIKLTKLIPGVLLLSLLFFYDIFWVFFSPMITGGQSVMLVVATQLDIPIKIVMPYILHPHPTKGCSLLGLGDILIPGIFICFLSNFGFIMRQTSSYFYYATISYYLSLICCGISLWVFHAAQPALLYIVPALLIATFIIAYQRNELSQLQLGILVNVRSKRNNIDENEIAQLNRDEEVNSNQNQQQQKQKTNEI